MAPRVSLAQPLRPTPIEDLLEPERDGTGRSAAPRRHHRPRQPWRDPPHGSVPASLGRVAPPPCGPHHANGGEDRRWCRRASAHGGRWRSAPAMKTLSQRGIWTVGLDAGGERSIFDLPVADEPIALVLGAEGPGLSRLVRERCDDRQHLRWPACSTASMSRTPQRFRSTRSPVVALRQRVETEPATGIEPATCCLQDSCSTN